MVWLTDIWTFWVYPLIRQAQGEPQEGEPQEPKPTQPDVFLLMVSFIIAYMLIKHGSEIIASFGSLTKYAVSIIGGILKTP
jgi:hypothetical protein